MTSYTDIAQSYRKQRDELLTRYPGVRPAHVSADLAECERMIARYEDMAERDAASHAEYRRRASNAEMQQAFTDILTAYYEMPSKAEAADYAMKTARKMLGHYQNGEAA